MTLLKIANGLRCLAQREGPADDRRELAGLYQVLECQEILLTLLGYEAEQLLPREERAHRGEDLALKAAKPAVSAFAADDDEGALRLESPAQLRQRSPSRGIEDQIEKVPSSGVPNRASR